MNLRSASLLLLPFAAACAQTPDSSGDGAVHWVLAPSARPLGDRVRVFDSAGLETDLGRLLDDVADADALFLGETHNDDVTHQVELEVLRGLIERAGGNVVLSMEMFERDVQPHLDRYLAGEIDEPTFLAHSRPWGNYRTAYRPLVELAKATGTPVIAANFPAPIRFKIRGQKEQWDALAEEDRQWVPRELLPNGKGYWERADRATRGHTGVGEERAPDERLYDGQSLWDNAMGESVADAIAAHPHAIVLHVAGGFHVQGRDGTVAQTAARAPQADLRVVNVWPQFDLSEAEGEGLGAALGDYTVLTAARAADVEEGRFSVEVGGDLRYKVRLPAAATDDAPVPLLVWLGDDGDRDDDGLRYWRLALGESAAVLAVDPLHLAEEDDLQLGGRWFWPDTLTDDAPRVERGLDRLLDYVTRRFPVDPGRIVLAGRGTGATTLLWTAMYTRSIEAAVVVAEPRRTGSLAMAGLPGQKSTVARLHVVIAEEAQEATETLLKDYRDLGMDVEVATSPAGDVAAIEAKVREALGIPAEAAELPAEVPVTLACRSPTARRWADLYARSALARGAPVRFVAPDEGAPPLDIGGVWSVADLEKPGAVPAASGPFGGTTVLVVPAGLDEEGRAEWERLAENDPLKKRSRFLRIVLVFEDDEETLGDAMEDLAAMGRRNVLIVPARFCATGSQMRALAESAGDALEAMTVHWLPGLGGTLAGLR